MNALGIDPIVIDEKRRALFVHQQASNRAAEALDALAWLAKFGDPTAGPVLNAPEVLASATPAVASVKPYVKRAFVMFEARIIEEAVKLAEADVAAFEKGGNPKELERKASDALSAQGKALLNDRYGQS